MMTSSKIRPNYTVLQPPYIRVDAIVNVNGSINGKPTIKPCDEYVIAPSAKKIATYIVNQIFGSELVTQTEGLSISWLMPTLKEALELGIYQEESFIYIHKFDNKIYLECLGKNDIHDLVQKYDKISEATIIQEIEKGDETYVLKRHIVIENGITYLTFKAFVKDKKNDELPISIQIFNNKTNSDYMDKYILPYEVLINIDLGQNFFKDSKKLLKEEMLIINTIADEIEKTKTRIVTTQHYQSGDIVTNWQPKSTHYEVENLTIGKLQDYFTLLPGDKEHQMFEFLQGNIRVADYINAFKFYDYQCIQMAGLSPASFGYEKDAYMNVENVDLSKSASDMTVEAIKSQIEPQMNKLIENIIKAQRAEGIEENLLPQEINWDYGLNEKFDDMKKIQVLRKILNVASVPYEVRAKIIMPIIKKLIDDDFAENNKTDIDDIIKQNNLERENIKIDFGEI